MPDAQVLAETAPTRSERAPCSTEVEIFLVKKLGTGCELRKYYSISTEGQLAAVAWRRN